MSTNVGYVQQVLANQQAMQNPIQDAWALQTRYIFVPFHDRELTLLQMQNLGGMPELKAGQIIPITRYRMLDLDYHDITNVPKGWNDEYLPVNEGVSKTKLIERQPAEVVNAIMETFNRRHETPDNGICEVEVLRGSDDMELLLSVNHFCLPGEYKTVAQQLTQLSGAVKDAPSDIYRQTAGRLLQATITAHNWAEWHYDNLEAAMEDRERSGKRRLSPLDADVCKWIEKPSPKFRTNLARDTQPQFLPGQPLQPVRPTIQCFNCGNEANLLPDGTMPRLGCMVCQSKTFGREVETAAPELPIVAADVFNKDNPMGEAETESAKTQRLAAEQARMRERLKAQKK